MTGWTFWLRWSWRDLRKRWMQVAAIALIISIGTGSYAALTSTSTWRELSNDASFELLNMHDVRVSLIEGVSVPQGSLHRLAASIPSADAIDAVSERLSVPTQLDVSDATGRDTLVAGRVIGAPPGTEVDRMHAYTGRALTASDDGEPVAVLEYLFADGNQLPESGTIQLSGGTPLDYVGQGTVADHIAAAIQLSTGATDASTFGVVFTSLTTAQQVTGETGRVNELVLTVRPGTERRAIADEIETAMAMHAEGLAGSVTVRDDEAVYSFLYDDIENDQQFWTIIAGLLLIGAALAAFNLINRVVEAQRREIGVGMALGLRRRHIAIRPALLGMQIAVTGAVLGMAVGVLVGRAVGGIFQDFIVLPIWEQPFQYGVYGRAALLGVALPLVAVAWPVWRAVRVQPVEAIRVGHLAGRAGRRPMFGHLALPGRSYHRMPIRNVLRAPRRTALTALGVGAVIAVLIAIMGLLDAFGEAVDRAEAEVGRGGPDRSTVQLSGFYPDIGREVTAVRSAEAVGEATPVLTLPATASPGDGAVDLLLQMRDLGAGPWQPTVTAGQVSGGLILTEKAAADLGAEPGDTIQLRHPARVDGSLTTVEDEFIVAGTHPYPLRGFAYLDRSEAARFGLAGVVNAVDVVPASGVDSTTLRRELFDVAGVAGVQSAAAAVDSMRDLLNEFTDILGLAVLLSLALTLLMAFNATSIAVDERAREHATMFAYGLPRRTVVGMSMVESALIGALGTLAGIAAGYLLLRWLILVQLPNTLPEVGLQVTVSGSSILIAILMGTGAVALTPLLTARRMGRMNVPAALRVVE